MLFHALKWGCKKQRRLAENKLNWGGNALKGVMQKVQRFGGAMFTPVLLFSFAKENSRTGVNIAPPKRCTFCITPFKAFPPQFNLFSARRLCFLHPHFSAWKSIFQYGFRFYFPCASFIHLHTSCTYAHISIYKMLKFFCLSALEFKHFYNIVYIHVQISSRLRFMYNIYFIHRISMILK